MSAVLSALLSILTAVLALQVVPAHALVVNGVFMLHDDRGPNDLGFASGHRIQYGATNVVGGSAGVTSSATYPSTGFTDPPAPCGPLAVAPNFCSNSTPFRTSRLAEPWNITFTKGAESLTLLGPPMSAAGDHVPHPTNVTISGGGITPTISWTLPAGYTPDGFRVQIFDHDQTRIRENGFADIIHNDNLSNTATSYTLPSTLETGGSLSLDGTYSINFQVIETRGGVPFTSQTQILSRSSSYFSFSPLSGDAPPNVFLPQVNENGVFQFEVGSVGPSSVTFIDPFVAIGYDYAIGAGDPNFASVIFPSIGDDLFELLFDGLTELVQAGNQFFFPLGGVSAFGVRGIETSAGLDPTDPTAFITGLTFVAPGQFTGTMTPITAFVTVSEPSELALMVAGLGLMIVFSRRTRRLRKVTR